MSKIAIIFGTRPEAIKIATLYHELKKNKKDVKVIITGQHREMLYPVLELFKIKVDYNLEIMKHGQSLSELTGRLIMELDVIFKKEKFDYVLVQGDTTSAFIGGLTAFYNKVLVGHIEAGLRSYDIYSPFPEEVNRRMIGVITDMHFAPTELNVENLLKEGYSKDVIYKVGNTVIDALMWIKKNKQEELKYVREKYNVHDKKYILFTMHRRENLGQAMKTVLRAIRDYLKKKRELFLVFPMHLNPKVRECAYEVLSELPNKILIEPLEYFEFLAIMEGAQYIMTDSGGVQEEAPSFGKPTLILRDTTERPEAILAGTAKLVGTSYENIIKYMDLLEGELYEKMSHLNNPYGDGEAAKKIIEHLIRNKKI